MTPAKAILFDFGGTLDADGVPWKDRMRRLCHDEGILGNAEPFDPIFYAADDALVGTIPASLPLRDACWRRRRSPAGADRRAAR